MDYYSITGIGSQGARKHTCNEHFFDTIDTQEKAYWLGFLFADGNVSNISNTVSISLKGDDIAHLEKFKIFINASNNIRSFI